MSLYHGDCLEIMPTLPAGSIDAIITDLPYGTTACDWDSIIPLDEMWKQVKRVLKPNGAFITTSNQPFTSVLIMSNIKMFKWDDVWEKSRSTGHLNAQVMPLRWHESVLVFCDGRVTYNPQFTKKAKDKIRPLSKKPQSECYGEYSDTAERLIPLDMSFPGSIIKHIESNNRGTWGLHPTQKPVALYEYLIRTYSNPSETILDIAMGSGTTIEAAIRTGRNSIGIEQERKYYEIAVKRVAGAHPPLFTETATPANNRLHPDVGDSPAQKDLFTLEAGSAAGKSPKPAPRR